VVEGGRGESSYRASCGWGSEANVARREGRDVEREGPGLLERCRAGTEPWSERAAARYVRRVFEVDPLTPTCVQEASVDCFGAWVV